MFFPRTIIFPLAAVVLLAGCQAAQPSATVINQAVTNTAPAATSVNTSAATTKQFTVTGTNYSFSLKEIKVKKGDTVSITFTDSVGSHNLMVDKYNVGTKVLGAGQSETITFVANQTGSFDYYCSVSNHRQLGMQGTLIVE